MEILFSPSLAYSVNASLVIKQSLIINVGEHKPLYFYSQSYFMLGNLIEYLSYWLIGMSWLSCLIGFIGRKLAGIETMFVVQWAWINILWTKQELLLPLMNTNPLKYSAKLSYNFFKT